MCWERNEVMLREIQEWTNSYSISSNVGFSCVVGPRSKLLLCENIVIFVFNNLRIACLFICLQTFIIIFRFSWLYCQALGFHKISWWGINRRCKCHTQPRNTEQFWHISHENVCYKKFTSNITSVFTKECPSVRSDVWFE